MVFMLIEQIRTDLNVATKARDSVRQRTLRSIIAAVQEAQVSGDTAKELDDDGVMAVLKAQVKRRIDAARSLRCRQRRLIALLPSGPSRKSSRDTSL